jgi:FkbH-like protein
MTGKTNQFNFNKTLYSDEELSSYISNGNRIYSLKVSDNYGSYGTVGLIMVDIVKDSGTIENFLMSCRALGKRIEQDFYNIMIEDLSKDNIHLDQIRFKKTEKNKPAQDFMKLTNINY